MKSNDTFEVVKLPIKGKGKQHIHFTTLGNIKKGDWIIGGAGDESVNEIWQHDGTGYISDEDRRIVASSNSKLKLPLIDSAFIADYNKSNGHIKTVKLEMETVCIGKKHGGCDVHWHHEPDGKCNTIYQPQTNETGHVIIYAIKKDEPVLPASLPIDVIKQICFKAYHCSDQFVIHTPFEQWFKNAIAPYEK